MKLYAGRDNRGRIVVDLDDGKPYIAARVPFSPADAERLAHELLALAYDHEANRVAYGDAGDTEDHDRAVDDALVGAQEAKITPGVDDEYVDPALANDNHPENDASGEPDFGGNG